MKVHLINNGYTLSAEFPMTAFKMQDALDRLKYPVGNSEVTFRIYEFKNMNLPSELYEKDFSADIYRLNLFAERLENLEFTEMAAFKSLLVENPESSFEDMLLMTYGLDSVMVYPCGNCYELGETVIKNEMIPELESCSDEILELIDREKVGKLMCEREGRQFIDDCYCLTSGYEKPDINIEIGRPESCFFRLLIVPEEEKTEQAQWISLPCETEITADFCNGICLDFQSSLPNLKFDDTSKIDKLKELAEQISELSHNDFVKLKAVMEAENICEISDTLDCIGRLSEYQFDRNISDSSDFGQVILERKQGGITSYGAISGRATMTEGIVKGSEQRLSRAMFKIAVELGAVTHMLAALNEIDDETLFKLRIMCVDEVKRINGIINFEKAVRYQRSSD